MKKIAIIGGGIVGLTAAYYLARSGVDVTLFDENTGQGTKAAAGIISPWFSLRRNKAWYFLVSRGAEFYHKFMNDLEEDGFDSEAIFQVDGAIHIRNNQKRVEEDLKQGKVKIHESPGIGSVKAMNGMEIQEKFPLIKSNFPGTWVEGGGRIHGDKLIETLLKASHKFGSKIIEERVTLALNNESQLVINHHEDLQFDNILLSPGYALAELLEPLGYHVDIRKQKGQLFVIKEDFFKNQRWPVVILPGQSDIIPFNHGEIIVGASHEDIGEMNLAVDMEQINNLKQEAKRWFPEIENFPIKEIKVGYRAQSSDYSVLIGPVPRMNNVWAISGLGSSGLTSGPYLAYQWSKLILEGHWDINQENYPIENYIYLKE